MNTRSATLLLAVALAAFAVWWAVTGGPRLGGVPEPIEGLTPGGAEEVEPAAPAGLPEAQRAAETPAAEPERETVALARTEAAPKTGELAADDVPGDAIWVEGRLVLALQAPADESIVIEARGRRFKLPGREDRVREYRAKAALDGTFRVAFAKGTRKGWIALDARYHYLEPALRIDLSKGVDSPLLLEPKLGGVIRTTVSTREIPDVEEPDLSGVSVLVHARDEARTQRMGPPDAENRFEARALPPGRYDATLQSSEYADGDVDGIQAEPGEVVDVTLELRRGVRVAGRVVDADGEGVASVRVQVGQTVRTEFESSSTHDYVNTEDDGTFEASGLLPSELELEIDAEGFVKLEHDLGERADGEVVEGLRLVLSRGLAIRGAVHWPDGSPAVGAEVRVRKSGPENAFFFDRDDLTTRTDGEGRFEVHGLDGGQRNVIASARPEVAASAGDGKREKPPEDWVAEVKDVAPGTTGLRLLLGRGGSVHGFVVDDTGAPLDRFLISTMPEDGTPVFGFGAGGESKSFRSEDGSFRYEGLRDGGWRLRATARGHAASKPVAVRVPYSGPEIRLVAPRQARIAGEVRDPSGAPIAGARVEAETKESGSPFHIVLGDRRASASSDERGEFELRRVDPGEVEVKASAPGFGASNPAILNIEPGSQVEGLVFVLRTPGRILGRVDPAAGPVDGRSIHVHREQGDFYETIESDASGSFTLESLTPGTYVLQLSLPETGGSEEDVVFQRFVAGVEERVELAEGETLHVTLGAPPETAILVTGLVSSGGAPLSGLAVTARRYAPGIGKSDFGARTDAAGRFEMALDGPGEYSFSFGNAWGDQTDVARKVPNRERVELVFDLPTGKLAGIVRTPKGAPAPMCPITLVGEIAKEGGEDLRQDTRFAQTRQDGTFSFTHLAPGTYAVDAGGDTPWFAFGGAEVYGRSRIDGIVLAEGQSITDLKIDLCIPGTAEGFVYEPDGSPAVGAWVSIAGGGIQTPHPWLTAITDAAGRFELRGLTPGEIPLVARKGELESEVREIRVIAEGVTPVDFHLRKP